MDHVGQEQGFIDIVRDEHNGATVLLPVIEQPRLHRRPRNRIELSEWLVQQIDSPSAEKRSEHRHSLAHPSGELARVREFKSVQPEAVHVFARPPARLFAAASQALEADRRVVGNRPPGHEHVLLRHVPHASKQFAVAKRGRFDRTRSPACPGRKTN